MTASSGVGRKVRNWALAWIAVAAIGVLIVQPGADAGSGSGHQLVYADGETVDIRDRTGFGGESGSRDIPHLALREPPDSVEFEFDPDLPDDMQSEIRGAVGLADAYFQATGAGPLPAVTVVASADPAYLIDAMDDRSPYGSSAVSEEWWDRYQGMYTGGTVYLRADWVVDEYGWQWQRAEVLSLVVHELAHAVHHHMVGSTLKLELLPTGHLSAGDGIPDWFMEGAAEVEAATALQAFGFSSFESVVEAKIYEARQVLSTLELSETWNGEAYTLGALAIAQLTQGGNMPPLRSVFQRMGSGDSFEQAFLHASKVTFAEFVRTFEQHRSDNFPPYRGRVEGHVTVTGGRPSDLTVFACSDDDICSSSQVERDGSFALVVADGRYRLEFSTVDDRDYSSGASIYYSLAGPVRDYEEATVFSVFGDTVKGFDLEIPADILEE